MTKIAQLWAKSSADERIVLGLVASIFLSLPVCILTMAIVLVYIFTQQRLSFLVLKNQKFILLLLFTALTIGMAALNQNLMGALVGLAMSLMIIIGAFIQSVMTLRLFKKAIIVACLGSIFALFIAVIQSLLYYETEFRFSSVFVNPNYYATIIEFVVILCVYALLQKPQGKYMAFYCITIALNIVGLYLCGCRSALFALGIAVAFMLFINKKYKLLFLFLSIAAIVLASTALFPEVFRVEHISQDFSTRASIWKLAIRSIKDSPLLGFGPMAYMDISMSTFSYAPHAHNIFLDSLLNYGIIGIGLIAICVYRTIKPLISTHKPAAHDNTLLYLLCGICLAILVHGATDVTILWPQTGLLFLFIWGGTGIYVEETVYKPAFENNICLLKATSTIVKRY